MTEFIKTEKAEDYIITGEFIKNNCDKRRSIFNVLDKNSLRKINSQPLILGNCWLPSFIYF
jgi:hypothetical protein